jgi:hypothetical protein
MVRLLIGKDVERSGCDIFQSTILVSYWANCGKSWNIAQNSVSWLRLKLDTC